MSMTSEKIQAPKPVGKFMLVMQRWHHIWHGEAQHTEPRMPMVKLYSEETVLSLLAERDADKALIAEQSDLISELEARTLTVKLPSQTDFDDPLSAYEAIEKCRDAFSESCAAAGIPLKVGGE